MGFGRNRQEKKRLKTFENIRKRSKSSVKRLKIFEKLCAKCAKMRAFSL